MKNLQQQIEILKDLDHQREIACHRFYSRKNQAIVLDQITEELRTNPALYIGGGVLNHLISKVKISKDVRLLFNLYKQLIQSGNENKPS